MPANLTVSNNTVLVLGDEIKTGQSQEYDYNVLALIFGILLIIVIICGNLLVCLSVYKENALKTTTNYFIVSLAVADLMLAVLVLPLFIYVEFQGGIWSLNMHICDGLMTMDVLLCTASIFNLCAISIDRFIAVSIPLNYNRKHVDQRQIFLLSGTWILALAVASPVIFGIQNVPQRDPKECKLEDDSYVVYSSVCSFFLPCPIMLLLYCGMFRGLRRWEEARKAKLRRSIQACRKFQEAASSLPPLAPLSPLPPVIKREELTDTKQELKEFHLEEQDPYHLESPDGPYANSSPDTPDCPYNTSSIISEYKDRSAPTVVAYSNIRYNLCPLPDPRKKKRAKINGRERKAMKVLPVVVGCFLFCWTPFFVVHTMRALCATCYIPPALMSTVTWLGYVNSALNPIIYTVFNTEFRNYFQKFLHSFCTHP
ncbi:dopamine receptor D4a [Esox lucius]|uniref:G-protein coupled receptors family 1 profile domain-containing protein n=1 Tax=Esox lucius TaxID=8010 RepID=A0A3P8XKJ5_ESOLU|nr:dopamine receptor D4a [Esox lucius]